MEGIVKDLVRGFAGLQLASVHTATQSQVLGNIKLPVPVRSVGQSVCRSVGRCQTAWLRLQAKSCWSSLRFSYEIGVLLLLLLLTILLLPLDHCDCIEVFNLTIG